MPWRSKSQPYYVWVSEMMLQQTQVATVIPYFNRFIAQFPTVYDLAAADEQAVLKAWEGLGYYSLARNLHKASKLLVDDYSGQLPSGYQELQQLPGIGPYCAAAITSIAFSHPVPVVDGNVLRVFTRFWGVFDDIRKTKVRDLFFQKLTPYIEESTPSDFNQAIMELGALVCKPKHPNCEGCPLSSECFARACKKVDELPYKTTLKPIPHYTIGVGVLVKDSKILIGKRRSDQMLGGLWEFPGVKNKAKESLESTVIREFKEETNLIVKIKTSLTVVKHTYSHFKITLHAFLCEYVSGKEEVRSASELKWVPLAELEAYPFPKANKHVLSSLKGLSIESF